MQILCEKLSSFETEFFEKRLTIRAEIVHRSQKWCILSLLSWRSLLSVLFSFEVASFLASSRDFPLSTKCNLSNTFPLLPSLATLARTGCPSFLCNWLSCWTRKLCHKEAIGLVAADDTVLLLLLLSVNIFTIELFDDVIRSVERSPFLKSNMLLYRLRFMNKVCAVRRKNCSRTNSASSN